MQDRTAFWSIIAICLAAFLAIALLADQIFEHVPHSEDEVAYVFQAKVFAQNRLTVPTPPNEDAFWSPFVVDYQGRRFGIKPPGWSLLLSLGVRLGQTWLINAVLAVLTLVLVAHLGKMIYGPVVGLGAALLGLLTPAFLFLSSSLLSHTASLFWTTVALIFFYRLVNSPTRRPLYATATGVTLGLIFITRPFAAIGIGLAIGVFGLLLVLRRDLPATVVAWLIVGGVPVAALLPLFMWAIGDSLTFNPFLLVWPYDKVGFGPDVGPKGYTLYDAIFLNTRLKLLFLAHGLFGWPGWTNLIFLTLPFLAGRATRWGGLLLGTLAGLVVVHNFYWSFGGLDGGFPRYYYDALPALLLLSARGIQLAGRYLATFSPRLQYVPLASVALLFAYSFVFTWPPLLAAQKGKYNITPEPLQVVARAGLSEPALVLVKDVEHWSDFAAPFTANSPDLAGPVVYAIDWNPGFTAQVRAQFEERTCWELQGQRLRRCPPP